MKLKDAYNLFHYGQQSFARAERQGIRVDIDYCESKKEELSSRIAVLEDKFRRTDFYRRWDYSFKNKVNIYSNPQLGSFLYKVCKYEPPAYSRKGLGSTKEEDLRQLGIAALDLLIKVRKLKKVRDTYLAAFVREQINGYVHPSFNLNWVDTYRSSSDKPNFQNIPKRDKASMKIVRQALYPRPGHQLMEVDYKNIEVRIAACYHNDPAMIDYINDSSKDMHTDMTKQLYLLDKLDLSIDSHKHLRSATKNGFVFPEFYGSYYKNCAKSLACDWGKLPEGRWRVGDGIDFEDGSLADHFIKEGIKSLGDFTDHVEDIEKDFWDNRFLEYKKWKLRWWKQYQRNGYFDMLTGFRCSGVFRRNEVINYPVQGSAFHCLLWAFNGLDSHMRLKHWDTKLLVQIHDAIVLDVHPDETDMIIESVKKVMTVDLSRYWTWINVPLEVSIELGGVDENWAQIKEIKT